MIVFIIRRLLQVVYHDFYSNAFQAITSKGGLFLEGPVSGSKKPAEDGQLVILAAGDKVRLLATLIELVNL